MPSIRCPCGAAAGLVLVLLLAPGTPAGAQRRLEQGEIQSGAASSRSASFRLDGCVSHDPGGTSSSAHHTIYAGCGATALLLPADIPTPTPTPAPPPGATPVPVLSPWAAALLAAMLAVAAAARLRRRA